jgi:thiol-disulfide isomerase/thioredoxin
VSLVVENYGESVLAERFGVTRYPAVFIEDVLVAKPKDFGFYGKGEGKDEGRYTPWKDPKSHARFKADLARMIDLVLSGRKEQVREQRQPAAIAGADEIKTLPAFTLGDLDGRPIDPADLAGRVVVVEFWATWCPPCRSTLEWLAELKRRHGDRVAVLAIAVESDEPGVRELAAELGLPLRYAMGTPEVARAFGDIVSVPTLFVFDREGRTAAIYFGAPRQLHEQAERLIGSLLD